jgi:hypothetical protein
LTGNGTVGGAVKSRVRVTSVITHWPRRYVIVALTFFGCLVAYTDRVNISVAPVLSRRTDSLPRHLCAIRHFA